MGKELFFLEDMLFKSTYEEIEERYAEVIQMYAHDPEIINIAKSIKGMCDYIMKTYKEIPNPEKKLDENLYTTLYQVLKDLSITLYDLSIAEGEQIYYVISSAYHHPSPLGYLFAKLISYFVFFFLRLCL